MERSQVDPQQPTLPLLEQLSTNCDWLRHKFAQSICADGISVRPNKQELLLTAQGDKDRRDPSTQTARRTVTVNLPLTGIHHSQVALAVHDLARDGRRSQIECGGFVCGRRVQGSNRARLDLDHGSVLSIDQLPPKVNFSAIETGSKIVSAVFSRSNQQIS